VVSLTIFNNNATLHKKTALKKSLLLFFLSGLFSVTVAQTIQFGIKAGVDGINMTSNNNGLYQSNTLSGTPQYTHNLMEMHGGLFADFNFGWFTVQPGAYFITKGGKNEIYYINTNPGTPYTYHATEELTLNCIEIPLNFLVKIPVYEGQAKAFFGGGPYVDLGLSAKDKNVVTYTYVTNSTETHNDSNPQFGTDIKNPGYGVNIMGGIALKDGVLLSIGYGWGLNKLSTNNSTEAQLRVLSISIGYCF
jgi:hypothetical protein